MSDVANEQAVEEQPKSPASLKQKRLSNGNNELDSSPPDKQKNGFVCNGTSEDENMKEDAEAKKEDMKADKVNNGSDSTIKEICPAFNGVKNGNENDQSVEENMDDDPAEKDRDEDKSLDKTPSQCDDDSSSNSKKESQDGAKTSDDTEHVSPSNKKRTEECKEKEQSDPKSDESVKDDKDDDNTSGSQGEESVNEDKNQDSDSKSSEAHEADKEKHQDEDKNSEKKEKPGRMQRHDSDDIQIVGESKVVNVSAPYNLPSASQNVVFVPAAISSTIGGAFPAMNQGFAATNVSSQWIGAGRPPQPGMGPGPNMMTPSVAPPQPKSSLDQIELIRWEIHNRINTRPKYFKPNTSSELGPLAKFLFDIGSDLIKETVYHELVKIQSKKGEDDKLTEKEKDDLNKLKEIEKDLHATIGHLKFKMKKRCNSCNFQTESSSVLYLHKQFPHEDSKKLHCSYCNFVSKQPMAYKFHLEAEHNVQPRLHDRKAFYECDMCPYENNQEQKIEVHRQRCQKQFRPLFNLHPSCLSGAEINLCLENIFYKPVVPKNLKLLQQKHAQQQAALLEAKRQQAQVQALAAQKNAAAAAARKQQQQLQQQQQLRQAAMMGVRGLSPLNARIPGPNSRLMSPKLPNQPLRQPIKGNRPTVANMLNNRQSQAVPAPPQGTAPGNFEVCEICGGYVKDRKALRIHFFYAHRIDLPFNLFERTQAPLYCATCYVRFWTAQGLRKHIDTHKEENITQGVVGKCISCGHHVLNLLIHMRIVHNREIQHYINALMCMFCGSSFNSRNDVERHIKLVHGLVDTVTGAVKIPPVQPNPQLPSHPNKGPVKKGPGGSAVKGSVCVLCNLNFGRNVDLTRHCMRMHHTCMKCGMVVIDKASLLKHTCLASPSGTRDCCMCMEKGFHPAYYVKHLRDKHLKKFSVKVARVSREVIERWTKRPFPFEEQKEILVEISDSDDDVPVKEVQPTATTASPKKKPKIGPAFFMRKQSPQVTEVVTVDDDEDSRLGKSASDVEAKNHDKSSSFKDSSKMEEQKGDENAEVKDNDSLKRKSGDNDSQAEVSPKRQKQS